jgi:hypothetical protein
MDEPIQAIVHSPHTIQRGPPPDMEPQIDTSLYPRQIVKAVELYENERYSPRLGFSWKSLLVLDRGTISNDDGTMW